MSGRRRICVATASRAEYGHLRWLVRDWRDDPTVDLTVVAAGAHLAAQHGNTIREIEEDGVAIDRVHTLMADDSPLATAKSMALATSGFAEAFTRLRPDLVVMLGDRYEMLAAASAAMMLRLPIAHIHGGETTEGAIDEAIRHAITKMAHLHFAAAEPYARRIVQLGEAPDRVFAVGAPGLDHLTRAAFVGRAELEAHLGMALSDPLLLVTYHPVTLKDGDQGAPARELVAALERFADARLVFTGINADSGNNAIHQVLSAFAAAHPERVRMVASLGSLRYLSLMRLAAAVVGNSSSGLIEAPALDVPTVNIGERQAGRLRAASVIDCADDRDSIAAAITQALAPETRARAQANPPPYGRGDASRHIREIIAATPLDGILIKRFHDLP